LKIDDFVALINIRSLSGAGTTFGQGGGRKYKICFILPQNFQVSASRAQPGGLRGLKPPLARSKLKKGKKF